VSSPSTTQNKKAESSSKRYCSHLIPSNKIQKKEAEFRINIVRQSDGSYKASLWDKPLPKLSVTLEHFLPYLFLSHSVGPRDRQRSWYNAYILLFVQPLEDLKSLLLAFSYLGGMRLPPPSLYKPVTVPPEEIGASGEYAAQILRARRDDRVHYLPPLSVQENNVVVPSTVRARNFADAVNDILTELGVDTPLTIDDVREVGFRLLFGQASSQHVGRGLSYLLPVIELGLIADPLRFSSDLEDASLSEYEKECRDYAHCAVEEIEAHLGHCRRAVQGACCSGREMCVLWGTQV
jgi:hypothetical protein